MPKRIVSVSIGSSKRNSKAEIKLEGIDEVFELERIGTDGSWDKAIEIVKDLDGKIDAFGLGGADLYVQAGKKRYTFRDSLKMARAAVKTPMVDGSGLKHTLERNAVRTLDKTINFKGKKVLIPSAVDRFGLAEAMDEVGAEVLYGDIIYALGMNIPVYKLSALQRVAHTILPVVVQLPFKWLYPTGEQQDKQVLDWRQKYFTWADVIAGDWLFIKRYMPLDMKGKIILTNTTTEEDVEMMRSRGVKTLITTTPRLSGRSFGTNVMEGFVVAVAGKYPLTEEEYLQYIEKLGLQPQVTELNP